MTSPDAQTGSYTARFGRSSTWWASVLLAVLAPAVLLLLTAAAAAVSPWSRVGAVVLAGGVAGFWFFKRSSQKLLHILPDRIRYEQGQVVRDLPFDNLGEIDVRRGPEHLNLDGGPLLSRAWWLDLWERGAEGPMRLPLHHLHYWDAAVLAVLLAARAPAGAPTAAFALLAGSSAELLKERTGPARGPLGKSAFPSGFDSRRAHPRGRAF